MFLGNLAVTFFLALMIGADAQSQAFEVRHGPGRMPTIEENLQRHQIELTKVALVDALRNADPEVRWLAAQKLAQDKATETIPAILEALRLEKVDQTRVNIAFALAQLGEEKGFATLQDSCRDTTLPTYRRLDAARNLVFFLKREDETCRKALVEILQSQPDPDSLRGAASLLQRFHDLPGDESQTIFQVVVGTLGAPEPSLRVAASVALREMGNSSAIPYLQKAIAGELDDTVRSAMQAAVTHLQQKQKQ